MGEWQGFSVHDSNLWTPSLRTVLTQWKRRASPLRLVVGDIALPPDRDALARGERGERVTQVVEVPIDGWELTSAAPGGWSGLSVADYEPAAALAACAACRGDHSPPAPPAIGSLSLGGYAVWSGCSLAGQERRAWAGLVGASAAWGLILRHCAAQATQQGLGVVEWLRGRPQGEADRMALAIRETATAAVEVAVAEERRAREEREVSRARTRWAAAVELAGQLGVARGRV